ncbi:MAG: FIST N domain protein [Alphaproteobacteria bacterium ADurb.BinA280]|jgi:hypothetical protein|nr:FIST C-terminal domain-containing protein [Xanthomonadales bacterium]MCC6507253.1 FIST C-terminal domain-containing protein [Aquimonas sp.]OPZ13966.1 MAG: FIST N domain protein [Alphaproteobacteria bacterium ADurb.BinA280]
MGTEESIRRGHTCSLDARVAAREFHAAVAHDDMALVLFFCSSTYDLDALAVEMGTLFGNTPVVGCTTAGEIGPAGYRQDTLTGLSFSSNDFTCIAGCLDDLEHFEMRRGQAFVEDLLMRLLQKLPDSAERQNFAFQMIDGLSVREEPVTRVFQHALGSIPLVGGSAGDGLEFKQTRIYFDGRFRQNAAVLVLVSTLLPVRAFKTQHFSADQQRVVVTAADAVHRVVAEIDGRPAAEAYAALTGVSRDNLDPQRFASAPMLVLIGGEGYVRSISNVDDRGALHFFCAIDEGMVLRLAKRGDLLDSLQRSFEAVAAEVGSPQLILGCDCVLRRVEVLNDGLVEAVSALMARHNVVGFATYGEQFHGVHVNQTFTGIAIGRSSAVEILGHG